MALTHQNKFTRMSGMRPSTLVATRRKLLVSRKLWALVAFAKQDRSWSAVSGEQRTVSDNSFHVNHLNDGTDQDVPIPGRSR